jgi:hypothetical protein
MGVRASPHIAKIFDAHNAKDDNQNMVRFPWIHEPPSHYGLLMIRRTPHIRLDGKRRSGSPRCAARGDIVERHRPSPATGR